MTTSKQVTRKKMIFLIFMMMLLNFGISHKQRKETSSEVSFLSLEHKKFPEVDKDHITVILRRCFRRLAMISHSFKHSISRLSTAQVQNIEFSTSRLGAVSVHIIQNRTAQFKSAQLLRLIHSLAQSIAQSKIILTSLYQIQ